MKDAAMEIWIRMLSQPLGLRGVHSSIASPRMHHHRRPLTLHQDEVKYPLTPHQELEDKLQDKPRITMYLGKVFLKQDSCESNIWTGIIYILT